MNKLKQLRALMHILHDEYWCRFLWWLTDLQCRHWGHNWVATDFDPGNGSEDIECLRCGAYHRCQF